MSTAKPASFTRAATTRGLTTSRRSSCAYRTTGWRNGAAKSVFAPLRRKDFLNLSASARTGPRRATASKPTSFQHRFVSASAAGSPTAPVRLPTSASSVRSGPKDGVPQRRSSVSRPSATLRRKNSRARKHASSCRSPITAKTLRSKPGTSTTSWKSACSGPASTRPRRQPAQMASVTTSSRTGSSTR